MIYVDMQATRDAESPMLKGEKFISLQIGPSKSQTLGYQLDGQTLYSLGSRLLRHFISLNLLTRLRV